MEKFTGQRTEDSQKKLEAKQQELASKAPEAAVLEAAGDAEAVVALLNERWGERGLTPEQCVFSLALVTINFRETVPEKFGGKAMFDRVAGDARRYYDENKDK